MFEMSNGKIIRIFLYKKALIPTFQTMFSKLVNLQYTHTYSIKYFYQKKRFRHWVLRFIICIQVQIRLKFCLVKTISTYLRLEISFM